MFLCAAMEYGEVNYFYWNIVLPVFPFFLSENMMQHKIRCNVKQYFMELS